MKKAKKIFLTLLSYGLVVALAITGTVAYLTSTDSDVNVMTLGNVKIEQLEYERVVENDAWVSTGETDEFGYTPDEVQKYSQDKPLYPAVFEDGNVKWDDRNGNDHQQSWGQVGANGSNQLYDDSVKNAQDKFVFVKNTGASDAYVRTWFAFEQGSLSASRFDEVIAKNIDNDHWSWEVVGSDVEIDGTRFVIMCATYLGETTNADGKLAPNTVSYPSLLQVYMTPEATNEDCEAMDGNKNGTYEILVYTQAVQTNGFDSAKAALDEAFKEAKVENQPWGDGPIHYDGFVYNEEELLTALAEGKEVKLGTSFTIENPVAINGNVVIEGNGYTISRKEGFSGTMFNVGANATFTLNDTILDGGAVWSGTVDPVLGRGTTNTGATATGSLIAASNNAAIILNEGSVLQNNVGANAVNLGTRIGATLTLNGGEIVNNESSAGAIWGGGHITINEGKINGNSSTGPAGAIRMVSNCNLTMNGGEISNNKAATDGGAIWGYGSSTYNFNGGEMSNNEAVGTGGAIYTGTYSKVNISGDFALCNNKAANTGAIRFTDHSSLKMTGGTVSGNTQNGTSNAFSTWNNTMEISGGTIEDDMIYTGGLALTIGDADINGVITYNISTVHNTAYLAAQFNGFQFKVNQAENFANFNLKPASGYTYTAGDEDKLVCLNEGYVTYWDAEKGLFKLKAE